MEISIKTVDGESMTLEIENPETIYRIKIKMPDQKWKYDDERALLAGGFQIFVKSIRTIALVVKHSDTIGEVKTKIRAKEGFIQSRYKLVYNGNLLEDGRTIADYNIKKEATLFTRGLKHYIV